MPYQKIPKSYFELVEEFKNNNPEIQKGEKLKFEGFGNKIIYNTTAPFEIHDPYLKRKERFIFARVESMESIWLGPLAKPREVWDPEIVLCWERGGAWIKVDEQEIGLEKDSMTFRMLEDPFISCTHDEFIFGGVTLDFDNLDGLGHPTVVTVFYKGTGIHDLKEFQRIRGMKDIRLTGLPNGEILVLTRPQGGEAGLGSIGITRLKNWDEFTQENIEKAQIIKNQVAPDTKLGSNELYLFNEGNTIVVGVLGHVAFLDSAGANHYSAMAFKISNPYSFENEGVKVSPVKVIATRENWEKGPAKTPILEDVIFPTGLVSNHDGTYNLYTGLSDAEQGVLKIQDLFV